MNYTPPKRRRLVLMRHGSVDYFLPNGQPVPDSTKVALNELGITQARAAGALMQQAQVRFDKVWTSGLPRTQQTARVVLDTMGHAEIPGDIIEALNEIRSGELSEVPPDQLEEQFLGPFRGCPAPSLQYLGGESVGDFTNRVLEGLQTILDDPNWEVGLLVAHGGANRAILGFALTGQAQMLGGLLQAPACINLLDVAPQTTDWIVRATNLNPTNWVMPKSRITTVEHMLLEYLRGQA
jgi:broad specificity phosphatase PhoE